MLSAVLRVPKRRGVAGHDSGFEIARPPAVADEGLKALYRYWCELGQAAGGMPPVRSFDPLQLARLLPNIWILEVEPDTHRFRMRLAGENINTIYGRSIGGRYFADLFAASDLETIVTRYTRALSEPAVFHATGAVYAAAGRVSQGERLGLPMLGRDGETSAMLGGTVYGADPVRDPAVRVTHDVARFYPFRAANHRPPEVTGP